MSINAKYLVHGKDQLVFQVSNFHQCNTLPKTLKEPRGGKIDWLEAFKIIKNGTQKSEINVSWAAKYEKIVTLRNDLLSIFSKIAPEELENASKFVKQFAEISNPDMKEILADIDNIFAKTVPLTNENMANAIYLHSEEKLSDLSRKVCQELKINSEQKICSLTREMDSKPSKEPFGTNWPLSVFKHYCKQHDFEVSDWHPSQSIDALIQELENRGPLLVSGNFGRLYFSKDPFLLKFNIAKVSVWGWDPQETLYDKSLSNPKWIGKEGHKVVIIGAQKFKDGSARVYFVDPLDDPEEQKIYTMSLEGLRKRIRDLWHDLHLDYSEGCGPLREVLTRQCALYSAKPTVHLAHSKPLENSQKTDAFVLDKDGPSIVMDENWKNSNTAHFFSELAPLLANQNMKQILSSIDLEQNSSLLNVLDTLLTNPDGKKSNPLQDAVHASDIETFNRILERLEAIGGKGKKEELLHSLEPSCQGTLMHIAISRRSPEMLERLLEVAPDLQNITNSYGMTPLMYAKSENDKKLIDILKRPKKVDVSEKDVEHFNILNEILTKIAKESNADLFVSTNMM